MARYIDADKLTFSRVRIIHSDGTIGGWHAVVMSSVIKDAPAADVVEVVRCKDCAYREEFLDRVMCRRTAHKSANGWFGLRATADHHYCSYGERKEQT